MAEIVQFPVTSDVFSPSAEALKSPSLLTQEYKEFCKTHNPSTVQAMEEVENHALILKQYLKKSVILFSKERPAPEGFSWGYSYEHGMVIIPSADKS